MIPYGALIVPITKRAYMNNQEEAWREYLRIKSSICIKMDCLRCKKEFNKPSSDLGPQLCQDCRDYILNKAERGRRKCRTQPN